MNIYFSGIGGVGIGPLAEIAADAGYIVSGSDLTESLVTRELSSRGIEVSIGQDGSFLQSRHEKQPIDWFVYTSALPDDHPELKLARTLGIHTAKRDELLAKIISDKGLKLLAVAGTHGKTTTTGMLIWTMRRLNIPISYSIGTTISFGPSGKYDKASEYFIYECDEFDRNFLHFHPYIALITAIDYDHSDTFPTKKDYLDAFHDFAEQSDQVITWRDQHGEIFDGLYQVSSLNDTDINESNLHGLHNRRNATLVQTTLKRLGITEDTGQILDQFPGTDRRFEKLADNLYSDYGHHPVEIASTLALAREISDHVVLVYQPHQNVRQHEIKDDYTNQFELADEIYWLPTYLSREDNSLPTLSPEDLINGITNKDSIHIADMNDELWDNIQSARDAGKLVLAMGAGTIDGWLRKQNAIKTVANILVIDNRGNIILQQRDNKPNITSPGMVTGFGGSVEGNETLREAAARELAEETNLEFIKEQLQYHKTIFQPTVNDGTSRWVTYFTLSNQDVSNLEVYEGQGYVTVTPDDNLNDINLSDLARQAIEYYRS